MYSVLSRIFQSIGQGSSSTSCVREVCSRSLVVLGNGPKYKTTDGGFHWAGDIWQAIVFCCRHVFLRHYLDLNILNSALSVFDFWALDVPQRRSATSL